MSSFLYAFESWNVNGGAIVGYNNDTGVWTSALASDPDIVSGVANAATYAYKGAWDGNSWYVISPSGGLHAYTPTSNTWKSLVSGTVIIQGTVLNNLQSAMTSDGSFIYHLSNTNDFRRYDPSLDTLTALATPPGTLYAQSVFLVYDGSGSIYGTKGGDNSHSVVIAKYNIAANVWVALPTGTVNTQLVANTTDPCWAAFLQGSLWVVVGYGGNTLGAFQYSPASGIWVTGATTGVSSPAAAWPGGEDSDSSIRIWTGSGAASQVYNIISDSWSAGANTPYTWAEGTSWCVTRSWSAAFTWYGSDGITALPVTEVLGSATLGQVLTFHAKVQTPVARAAGVTISVPINTSTDAATAVTICNTVNGAYGTAFTTGSLGIGDEVDVYIKVVPNANQTLGLSKNLFLEVAPN